MPPVCVYLPSHGMPLYTVYFIHPKLHKVKSHRERYFLLVLLLWSVNAPSVSYMHS